MRSKRRRELACPERGGGCECNEQTEGLNRGCSYLRQPLSQTFGLPAPRPGSLLGALYKLLHYACPERGFEPSAPSGRCSEGRIGRNREYCKRQRSKTTIFQPALWMRVQRADGGVASGLLLFTATPQSIRLAAYCQLPGRGAFWVRYYMPRYTS